MHAPAGVLRRIVAVATMASAWAATGPPLQGRGLAGDRGMVQVPAGRYRPLFRQPTPDRKPLRGAPPLRQVPAFEMDVHPVTNAQFLVFVHQHPEWRKSRAKALFVDQNYLAHWRGDLDLGPFAPPASPVVNVSWFAARAYLAAQGKVLPTVDQWEYVAAASEAMRDASREPAFLNRLRSWYGRSAATPLPAVGAGSRSLYGVHDLHGLVSEWTLDFNSALVTGESRGDSALERTLYCGSGAVGAADFENYPAFMRYALRSSLESRYSVGSVGFRGVRNPPRARP
jgi:formylglycine-generating enzyme required for sulfatase activity